MKSGQAMQLCCEGHPQIECTSISKGMRVALNRPMVVEEPVFVGDSDVDANGASIYGSVIRDGGVFRMWYQAWPRDWDGEDVITVGCVESDDGYNWRRPKYGLLECMGSAANHLTDLPFHSPSVIIDPEADADRRYRAFGHTMPSRMGDRFPRQVNSGGYFTAYSSDGLHWTLESLDPLWPYYDVITSVWDPVSRCARIALKNSKELGGMPRRSFSTAEWKNGIASDPVSALLPDEYDDITARARGFNSGDYYGVGLMPTDGPTIGFLWNFRHYASAAKWGTNGRVDFSIAYQLERGGCWRHVSGRPDWFSAQDAPEWAQGAIYTAAYPIDVGDETWLYFCGSCEFHGWCGDGVDCEEFRKTLTDKGGFARIGLLKWRKNRIIGYRSDLTEHISLIPRKSDVGGLVLNVVTKPRGSVRVQLVSAIDGQPVSGYEYGDCEPIVGDHLEAQVRWKGKDALPATPVVAQVEVTGGILYAFSFTQMAQSE